MWWYAAEAVLAAVLAIVVGGWVALIWAFVAVAMSYGAIDKARRWRTHGRWIART